jgi:aspartate/methionine/tyrosine aminotransferase
MIKKDLTQLEIPRLPESFNLTDGHAHRSWDAQERKIISRMAEQFAAVRREDQPKLEAGYLAAFYGLAGQTIDTSKTKYLFLQSASMSLELVANHLRLQGLDLALIEPCFDNLANIFKRHDVKLESLPDHFLENEEEFESVLKNLKSKAICIVSPNNPTGICYTRRNFERLIKHCQQEKKLLILDTCFRMYKPHNEIFDEYALLQKSGIDYIVIEDTGKTWPTKELKVSILAMSANLFWPLYDIYTDFIYHHSPFVIELLTEFVKKSQADKLQRVHQTVQSNRKVLHEAIKGSVLVPAERPAAAVAWLKIEGNVKASRLEAAFAQNDIFVLPGNLFFWDDISKGESYIRVALVRDPAIFAKAAKKIQETLSNIDDFI